MVSKFPVVRTIPGDMSSTQAGKGSRDAITQTFEEEVLAGKRFRFGRNWTHFLTQLNEDRIRHAESSLLDMLEMESLSGKRFLDVGSGSGLFSLAARRLGASVHSFDFDVDSVACTNTLRDRYFPDDPDWRVEQGSILDADFVRGLGTYDITYAWGVLHHTGRMFDAMALAGRTVASDGLLFIMIYEDRGFRTRVWRSIKRLYCSGSPGRWIVCSTVVPYLAFRTAITYLRQGKNPLRSMQDYASHRGMSQLHDWIDWMGGYPFEFSTPEAVIAFYARHGFALKKQRAGEFVFRKLVD